MASTETEKAKIKTNSDLIYEIYEKRLTEFKRKLKLLAKRNRSLARYIYLKAYALGALEYPEMLQKDNVLDYQPKRGKKQERTFPIKIVQEALKCSHRQASIYHLAGWLSEEVIDLAELQAKSAMVWKAEQQGAS